MLTKIQAFAGGEGYERVDAHPRDQEKGVYDFIWHPEKHQDGRPAFVGVKLGSRYFKTEHGARRYCQMLMTALHGLNV